MTTTRKDVQVTVSQERLWNSLMTLAKVGSYYDEQTGLDGVNRLALTDADAEGRRLVMSWMREAGLRVRVDEFGNVYGHHEGRLRDAPPVLVGSHIDSVARSPSSPRKRARASAPTCSAARSPPVEFRSRRRSPPRTSTA